MTEAELEAAAARVGLALTPGQLPGVSAFFAAARDMAAVLDAVPLDDGLLDLAPVFRLPDPDPAP